MKHTRHTRAPKALRTVKLEDLLRQTLDGLGYEMAHGTYAQVYATFWEIAYTKLGLYSNWDCVSPEEAKALREDVLVCMGVRALNWGTP